MLKIKLLLSFIFFTSSLFAQPLLNNFKINWDTVSIITAADEEQYPMLNFDGAVYNGTSGLLPSFRFDFAVPDSIKNVKVEILNQQFERLQFSLT